MRVYKPALVVLFLSVGVLLVAGAARKQSAEEEGHFPVGEGEEHANFDEEHGPHGHHGGGGGHEGGEHHNDEHHNAHHEGGILDHKGGPMDMLGQVSNGLSGIIGGGKVAPLSPAKAAGEEEQARAGHGPHGHHKEQVVVETPVKHATDLTKLFLNPLELTKHIGSHFKLPLDKLMERIGSGLVVGMEALLQPLMACIKIVEKVFQPDTCRLKFMCRMGAHLHFIQRHVLRFSPSFIDGSVHLKAFHEGFSGQECEAVYPDCDRLRLKRPFEELKGVSQPKVESSLKV